MNILVLGGNGYLGKKLVGMLREQKHNVTCTIRKSDSRENYIYKDVIIIDANIADITDIMIKNHYDIVVNAVCNYGRSEGLYGDVIEANIEFPLKVLDMAAEYGVSTYITIGTGLPDRLNMYSYSKKMFSEFGGFYVEKKGINYINMKLEMFYGADEPADRFIPSVIRKMIMGEVVNTTIGVQHRDIIYIGDILKAMDIVINSDILGYKEIYVGTGIAPTISEIIDYIWMLTGKKSIVNKGTVPMRKDEPDCIADTSILKNYGDWAPIFWKDGLREMVSLIEQDISRACSELPR